MNKSLILLALAMTISGCYRAYYRALILNFELEINCPKEDMTVTNQKGEALEPKAFNYSNTQSLRVVCAEPKAVYACKYKESDGYSCELSEETKRVSGERKESFVASEYAPYTAPGTATIQGQAFFKTRAGDVKYGAGNDIMITPITSYSTEFWERSVKGQTNLNAEDSRVGPYLHLATADGEGRFKVSNLPPGQYYAYTYISWELLGNSGLKAGGWVGAKVTVADGAVIDTILKSVVP